jgi:hypothetical protein
MQDLKKLLGPFAHGGTVFVPEEQVQNLMEVDTFSSVQPYRSRFGETGYEVHFMGESMARAARALDARRQVAAGRARHR